MKRLTWVAAATIALALSPLAHATESTTEAAITPAAARQIGEFVLSHFR